MVDPTKLNDYVRDYIDDKEVCTCVVRRVNVSHRVRRSALVLAFKPSCFPA
jgi:hypothetical protein